MAEHEPDVWAGVNVGSLFSGIGGMDVGLERAGFRVVFQCESDEWRQSVLSERFPAVPIYDDIREVVMARQAWNKGKSYTFAKRTVYANKGTWIAAMRRMFAPACMCCGWDKAVCDTHHITPKRDGGEMTLENGIILCPNCHRLAESGHFSATELRRMRADAEVIGTRIGGVEPPEAAQVDLICGGFPLRAKTSQSQDEGVDSKGNGADSSIPSLRPSMLFDPEPFSSRMFQGYSVRTAVGTSESCLERWPSSGTAWHGGFSTHVSSECRSDEEGCSSSESSLSQILEEPQSVPAKYSLSARAASGILRRAAKRGRTLPGHLEAALVSVAGHRTLSE